MGPIRVSDSNHRHSLWNLGVGERSLGLSWANLVLSIVASLPAPLCGKWEYAFSNFDRCRLSFLADGAAAAGGLTYRPILIDCDDETRSKRLTIDRGQPELANKEMMNWARYLRHSARIEGCDILDTSSISLNESVLYVSARLVS
jgi:hypothetical protein